ncbi:O-antigen ligase family protein [Nocardioides hwasunensis]|uniref:O-antigen ligase family protein n=1 Tax=Nocardioides hwasunensis TaxID=397258 RepID=A0ABR8MKU5_9ACTN|nr:O-antigen ligase family protein [Nocardioides hwasunensis]MBD3916640.1 O-antigen ligase family protein [Nocardioides hwasunensis]
MTLSLRRSSLRAILTDHDARAVVLLTALLVSTQIVVTVPNPFSLGGGKSLPLAEIPLVIITVWLVVSFFRRRDVRFAPDDLYLIWGVLLFAATVIVVTALRALTQDLLTLSTTSLEYMTLGIAFYFTIRLRWFTTHHLVLAIHGLLLVAEATALFRVVFEGTTLRFSAPMGNVNVYVGFALLVMPVLIWYGISRSSRMLLLLTLGQMAIVVAFVALSGSRFGGLALLIELTAIFLLVDDRRWRTRLSNIGLSAVTCGLIMGAILVVSPATSKDIQRTLNVMSAVTGQEVASAGDDPPSDAEWRALPPVAGGPGVDVPTDPASVDPGNPDIDVRPDDQSLRARFGPRATAVAHDHWLLGTGRPVVFYYGYGYSTSHSIIFDPVIAFGVFGAVALWALLLRVPISMARAVRGSRRARAVSLGVALLLAYSFFEPLIDSVLVIGLMYWGLFAVGLDRSRLGTSEVGVSRSDSEPVVAALREGRGPSAT